MTKEVLESSINKIKKKLINILKELNEKLVKIC